MCHEGYEGTDQRPPQDGSNAPMNEDARCTEPASQSNARGAQNAPARRRRPTARPWSARTTRRRAKLTLGDPARDRTPQPGTWHPAVTRRGVVEVAVPPAPAGAGLTSRPSDDRTPSPRFRSAAAGGARGRCSWRPPPCSSGSSPTAAARPTRSSRARAGHGAGRAVRAAHRHLRPRHARRPGQMPRVPRAGRRGDHRPSSPPTSREQAATAEQLVAQGGIGRAADVFAHRRRAHRRRLRRRCWWPARSPTATRRAARRPQRPEPVPFRYSVDLVQDRRRVAGRRLRLRATDGRTEEHAMSPSLVRPPRRRPATRPTDEIRAAWKSAIADLEPGDRRFGASTRPPRCCSTPTARAAYDAELAARGPRAEPGAGRADRQPEPPTPSPSSATRPRLRGPAQAGGWSPGWLLVGSARWPLAFAGRLRGCLTPSRRDDSATTPPRTAAGRGRARGVPVICSYDYEHLDEDHDKAARPNDRGYREEYDKLFDGARGERAADSRPVTRPSSSLRASHRRWSGRRRPGAGAGRSSTGPPPTSAHQGAALAGVRRSHHGKGGRRLVGRRHQDSANAPVTRRDTRVG